MSTYPLELQRQTLPGKVEGIVGWDPMELQCRDCGAAFTAEKPKYSGWNSVITRSGFHFHRCEGRDGIRRCPECLAAVKAACPKGHDR